MFLLTRAVGHVADRHDRRLVARVCRFAEGLAARALAVGNASGWLSRESLFAIVFASGAARAFEGLSM